MWRHFVITDRRGLEIPVIRTEANASAGPFSRLWEAKQAAPNLGRICKGQPRIQRSIFQDGCQAPRWVNKIPQELIMWLK